LKGRLDQASLGRCIEEIDIKPPTDALYPADERLRCDLGSAVLGRRPIGEGGILA